jgi:glycosyltransferase involved in cell wall biosynthesis
MVKTKVLAIYNNTGPCYHRVFIPLSAMPEIDVTFTNHIGEEGNIKTLEGFNVVFVNRMFPLNKLSEILEQRKKYGFRLIVDLDDHWDLDPSHMLYNYYKTLGLSAYIEHAITVADAVSVTHERLAEQVYGGKLLGQKIMSYNKNVWILPNSIDSQHPQFKIRHEPGAKTRLFWAGGITHEQDIAILRNPVKRIHSDSYLKERVMMVMGGYMKGHGEWDRMASTYTNGLQLPGAILEGRGVADYYSLYQYADVCMIPLQDNRFNWYKSNLKILEAANMSKPVVVSNVDPYRGFPPNLVNYVERQSDWYRHVRRLVRDPYFAEDQGKALKQYCDLNYNFDVINKERLKMLING